MPEPIAVTGAAGFIGRHLVEHLLDDGRDVRALLLPDEIEPKEFAGRAHVVRGDVTRPQTLDPLIDGVGAVVHLAAVVGDWGPEAHFQRVTVDGTAHVLRRAAAIGARAVLASSIVVYGDRLGRGKCPEETPHGRALGPYSRAKMAQEKISQQIADDTGMELVIVRPANVYGPGSMPWLQLVLPLLEKRLITLIDGGDFDAGLCHVDNLVDMMVRALDSERAPGRIYNAADGLGITWRRYFSDLARLIGAPPPRSMPRALANPLASVLETLWRVSRGTNRPPMTREALNLVGSAHQIPIERARQELGYEPRVAYGAALAGIGAWLSAKPSRQCPGRNPELDVERENAN